MKTNLKESKIRSDFEDIVENLDAWGTYVDKVINEFVDKSFPSCEHIQSRASHRIKNIDSYCQKVLLRGKDYENPLLEVTDKVATRIICLSTNDVDIVSDFVVNSHSWKVIEIAKTISDTIVKNPDLFTYRSNHYIVQPNDSYKCKIDKNLLTCEIQVRTLLQHAYAELSHEMFYKQSVIENPIAQHMLASSMAFIEAADERFVQIYDNMKKVTTTTNTFKNKIVKLYKNFCLDYDENIYNEEISQKILKIYTNDDIRDVDTNIEEYLNDPNKNISNVINKYKDNYILFKYPYVLILLYGIRQHQRQTIDNWPFSYESLKILAEAMGISSDSL